MKPNCQIPTKTNPIHLYLAEAEPEPQLAQHKQQIEVPALLKRSRPVPRALNETKLQKAAWANIASGVDFKDLLDSGGDPKEITWFNELYQWVLSAGEEPTLGVEGS